MEKGGGVMNMTTEEKAIEKTVAAAAAAEEEVVDSSEEESSGEDTGVAVPVSVQERVLSEPEDENDDDDLVASSTPSRPSKVGSMFKKTFSHSAGGLMKTLSNARLSRGMSKPESRHYVESQDTNGSDEGMREAIRVNAQQTAKTYNAPALINSPYGVRDSVDALSLFHNGAREELGNAFHMIALMDRFGARNSHEIITHFWMYFEVIWDFVSDYFDVEESVMFACLEERRLIPFPEMSESTRRMNKLSIVLRGCELKKQVQWFFSELSIREAQLQLKSAVTEAAVALSEYFLTTEKLLPDYIDSVLDAHEVVELEKNMLSELVSKGKRAWANAHIAVRWQSDPTLYQTTVSRHFSGKRMLDFKRYQKTFETEHEQILKNFNDLGRTLLNSS
eukprot:CAMPEP_0185845242 /NCGR_PEP_ID=MMETSP1354-20130828/1259_1 /TAXON_ID=708628 /ORGANISM="Erythrolobus madagascarensis, Strain CCMP3276" /LENGTH=391 /DNA_ID=CAMNT_0028545157 /DNA_START=162 /DNA_END=1337 /DNA_ORIENTATION=-